MNGQRIGAVVLAIALVVGAFVIRRNVIEGDDDSPSTDGTEVDEPDQADATALYCITELTEACEGLAATHDELDITIEDAGETLDRLAALGDDERAPLWLTIDPYPAMVDFLRPNDPVGFETEAVGASQLTVAFRRSDRAAAVAAFCEGEATSLWRCLGGQAGAAWPELGAESIPGTLEPSLGDVANSAVGLMSFGSAIASYFGSVDVDRTQFDDTAFIGWLRRLSRESRDGTVPDQTPFGTMFVRETLVNAAATATFEITQGAAIGNAAEVKYSDPQMWIQAVIATPAGVSLPDGLAADVTSALGEAGWDTASAADGSVPSASTLLALRQLWNDYTT